MSCNIVHGLGVCTNAPLPSHPHTNANRCISVCMYTYIYIVMYILTCLLCLCF